MYWQNEEEVDDKEEEDKEEQERREGEGGAAKGEEKGWEAEEATVFGDNVTYQVRPAPVLMKSPVFEW